MKKIILYSFAACLLLAACTPTSSKKAERKDILSEDLDTTINPAKDFFSYANGGWIKKNPIPASERRWSIANLVRNETYDRMRKLSEEAGADAKAIKGSN